MYMQVSEYMFIKQFKEYGRVLQFGKKGLRALYAYLTELENFEGEQITLDVIAICCDFQRWESLKEYSENYSENYADTPEELEHFACMIADGPAFITHAH